MKDVASQIDKVLERGVLRNLVSSSRDDLVEHANGQNRVNTLLLKLQREAIALNTLGYAYLTSLIAEFERQVNEGVRDSDGKIHVLSSKGKEVAQMAKEMFNAILDTSESTQSRIDANTATVAEHERRLAEVTHGLGEQAERTAAFEAFRLASTQTLEELGRQQAGVLAGFQVHESERAAMQSEVATLRDGLSRAGEREADLQRKLRRLLWTVWPAIAATTALSLVTLLHTFGWV